MGNDESGINVYPRLPVPKAGRESDPSLKKSKKPGAGGSKLPYLLAGGAAVAGIVVGALVRPVVAPDPRIEALSAQVATEKKATKVQADKAAYFEKQQAELAAANEELAKKLAAAEAVKTVVAASAAEVEKRAKEVASVEAKLRGAVDKGSGTVSTEGEEVRLQLVDKVLFKTNDDQLTPQGKALIDKVAGALKELPDKQIWVQGHTDDQPIFNPPPPPPPKTPAKKGAKVAAAAKDCPAPGPKFATNWELSAARALTVVHYLQDVSKLEPARLAALAFGQYRPVNKANKAANRRIEIVLYPRHEVAKK